MHDLQEQFYKVMTRLRTNSRAASTQEQDARVTEMINGLLVSRSSTKKSSQKEPEIIDLQEYAKSGKAASVQSINKVRAIHNFISSNGRYQLFTS